MGKPVLTRGFGTLDDGAPGPDLVHNLLPIRVPSGRQDEAKDLCGLLGGRQAALYLSPPQCRTEGFHSIFYWHAP